jgi:hypothetical protein
MVKHEPPLLSQTNPTNDFRPADMIGSKNRRSDNTKVNRDANLARVQSIATEFRVAAQCRDVPESKVANGKRPA